jgi:hypothetical protein
MSDTEDTTEEQPNNQPNYDGLEVLVQEAQDALEPVKKVTNGHRAALESIEDGLEHIEDVVDDAQDTENRDLLDEADAYVDDVQTTIRHLEDRVDYDTNTQETVDAMNGLDNAVEALEDALEDEQDGDLVVQVSHETFVPDEFVMTPSEILEAAGFDKADYLLYHGADADEEEPHIEKGTQVDLREHHIFSAIPDETGYGGATSDDSEGGGLPTGLAAEVEELRKDYDVDVDSDAEAGFYHVIVRDYPVPVAAYNKESTDTLIRVPENYPEQAPDWVYVDEDFRVAGGDLPRKAQTPKTNPNNTPVLDDWVSLSWHISNLPSVTWQPYQHDLRWYLETIVRGRLEQGD